ncbi:MAG: nicotinate-nucleotide adenylyltransferase [Chloroflexi bacterium]|nr:nicotinate-nucleotide adenylyltransferase [Chloroflexota bacterium]
MGVGRTSSYRLGVLGGTFDPVHMGHLIIAEEARCQLSLSEVLFVPTGQPYMKTQHTISPGHHRLEMVKLATDSNPYFKVTDMELRRPGPSYTVDTLEALVREYPSATTIFLILGLDSLGQFHRWQCPRRILELCSLVAVQRPGVGAYNPAVLERELPGASQRVVLLQGPSIGVSGTDIRKRVAKGLSIKYWVPDRVDEYIRQHRLYQGGADHG